MTDRPPFILGFMADNQGCGYHRIMMPLGSMLEAGAVNGRVDMAIWPEGVAKAVNPDVVIWQRQVEDGQIEAMERWRRMLPDALFVYELDDYLGEIPPASFHASFMPADICDRVQRALRYVDRVTTTTKPMAEWLTTLTDAEVIVIPNGLPVNRFKERQMKSGKIRVGFAGGISHDGDLKLLHDAMSDIGEDVTWVFFGMKPKNAPCEVEFHEGVPPFLYLDRMAALDVDLMLAPLEDNKFNRCKSNLRLIEAASVGAAVIAQDMAPYLYMNPPVYEYAHTPRQWTLAIKEFMKEKQAHRQRSADSLRAWAGRHYSLERLLKDRIAAWTPEHKRFKPVATLGHDRREKLLISYKNPAELQVRMPALNSTRCISTLEEACQKAMSLGADVLWLRPETSIDKVSIDKMLKLMNSAVDIASVVPLTSDGLNGFPQPEHWNPLGADVVSILTEIVSDLFPGKVLPSNSPSGPAALLSVRALGMLGIPDVAGCGGNEEQAVMEWGLMGHARKWRNVQAVDTFAASLMPPAQPTPEAVMRLQARGYTDILRKPLDATLLSDERERIEAGLVVKQWGGPKPGTMGFDGDYDGWCFLTTLQDPNLEGVGIKDAPPICPRTYATEKDWPEEAWVLFIDDRVTLKPGWSYWFQLIAKVAGDAQVIYADHENVSRDGRRLPEFKPDFDLTLLLAQDYITPCCAVRASLLGDAVLTSSADLFKLLLDCAKTRGRAAFVHIPKILAEVDISDSTPDVLAFETVDRQLSVEETFPYVKAIAARQLPGCLLIKRDWRPWFDTAPKVSIVIPTLGQGRLIQPCVATILQHTSYANYEVIVVQNGKERAAPELTDAVLSDPRVKVVHYKDEGEFNWSKINNWAIRTCTYSPFIVTMNDDVMVGSDEWLDAMMGHAALPSTGAVGIKLVHPMGIIQHVGVICHNGIAGHVHKGIQNGQPGHLGRAILSHENIAVTGACMLFSREAFDSVDGFNEALGFNYNDTVFCIDLYKAGRNNIVETGHELLHSEGASRQADSPKGLAQLERDNLALRKMQPGPDPFWNQNLNLSASTDGTKLYGLNADMLAWNNFVPKPGAKRVLLINDLPGKAGLVPLILTGGNIPMVADLSGFTLKMTGPVTLNIRSWDIRNAEAVARGLRLLKVDQIILRSLVGAEGAAPPIETLRTLKALRNAFVVSAVPSDVINIAPWLAEDGRKNAHELFGFVDLQGWKTAYDDIVNTSVTT